MGYQHQHNCSASAEDIPVSMSGHLVAADSTSEEQFWIAAIAKLITRAVERLIFLIALIVRLIILVAR